MADQLVSPKLLAVNVAEPDRLAFNGSDSLLAVGDSRKNVAVILDLADGKEVARIEKEGIRFRDIETFEFFEDKLLGIRHQPQGACVFYDVHRGKITEIYAANKRYPQGAAVDPNGRYMAVGFKGSLVLYDLKKREVRWERTTNVEGTCFRPAFSPCGKYVAGDFMMNALGGIIIVWDTDAGKRWRTLEVNGSDPIVAFQRDSLTLAIGENGLALYEPNRGDEPVVKFDKPSSAQAVAFRDMGKTLVALGSGNGLVVIDLATGKAKRKVNRPSGRDVGYSVPNSDWSLIASTTKGGVLIWPSGLEK